VNVEAGGSTDPAARAAAMAPLAAAAADEIEAASALPARLLDALHAAGLFRLLLPRAFGGEEAHPVSYLRMLEIMSAADASTAWCLSQNSGCSMVSAYLKPEVTLEIWGTDPRGVLAWGAGPQGLARVVDGGYRVSGSWSFASGIRHATWLGGHSLVEERDGTLRRGPDGEPVERTMLFRKQAAAIVDNWNVVGLRGTGSDSYSVTDLFIPDDYSAGRDCDTERRELGPLYRFTTMTMYASGFAAVALGVARAVVDAFTVLAQGKAPRAAGRVLRDSQVVHARVAIAEAKLGAARSFLHTTLSDVWNELARNDALTLAQRMRIRLAATYAIHEAKEVVDIAYHDAGATAIFATNPFERRFRDINTITQQVQGRAAHFETVGAFLLGKEANLAFV
jgi:alkylation response protein AidB-like acyl-CoA dehydrogenase